ncbi:hypothetical protein RLOC_00009888 [Lonchura striata]|nr:hypothetical protein RLOC_00009888 [Lonchura striata domestica]
MSAHSSP